MNLFRLAGDLTHLASFVVLLLKILATRSCRGEKRACVAEGGSSGVESFTKSDGKLRKKHRFCNPAIDGEDRLRRLLTYSPLFLSPLSLPPLTPKTGISLRTQELYTLVFVCRYLDLFTR